MKGLHKVIVQNNRLHYEFDIKRNITIIQGNSATGKTTLITMLLLYAIGSGSLYWNVLLQHIKIRHTIKSIFAMNGVYFQTLKSGLMKITLREVLLTKIYYHLQIIRFTHHALVASCPVLSTTP